jgi:thioredoxin reductase (NADPH)
MDGSLIEADAVIIGAGPVGLFQAFQLGLHEIRSHIIDALPYAGGQCIELYADKPIYDIPGLPCSTGRELTQNLLRQIAPFEPHLHFSDLVESVLRVPDGRLQITTAKGQQFKTKTLFVAAGVGAFVPRKATLQALAAFEGRQVHYLHDDSLQSEAQTDTRWVVLGGDQSAIEAALRLTKGNGDSVPPRRVTLIHRRDVFGGDSEILEQFEAARASGRIEVIAGQLEDCESKDGRLSALSVLKHDGDKVQVAVDQVLVRLGVSPKMGPIADWGLALERKQVPVNTENFQSEIPGIFAVGDINTYPGKRKLIVSGFHEATLAAFGAMRLIAPNKEILLQYTTTSPRLQALFQSSKDQSLDQGEIGHTKRH